MKRNSQDALKAIRELNFGEMAYRGYLVKRNALSGEMWIERDGVLIHRVPLTKSWDYARQTIDGLLK
jgi:hypothetical protein